nr:carbohydrate ABC transporter permease [Gardnerella vaginalis]
MNEKTKHPVLWTTLFAVVSLLWIFPIALVFMNSFKSKVYIASEPFS